MSESIEVIDNELSSDETAVLEEKAIEHDHRQPMGNMMLIHVIEAVIFASDVPVSFKQLQKMLVHPDYAQPTTDEINKAINELCQQYHDRGITLQKVASGYRFQIQPQYANWLMSLWDEKPPRYSRALLETLVLVAYRQPITRAEIEEVRGVAVSTHIMKTLTERGWVRVVGHRDVPGKPSLYATTKAFLDYFNLPSLDALPTLEAVRDLDSIAAELGDEFTKALMESMPSAEQADETLANHDNEVEIETINLTEDSVDKATITDDIVDNDVELVHHEDNS